MSKRNPHLVALIMSHLHTVMRLEQSMGELSWFQYDWKARREMCPAGVSSWARQDLWQLLTCVPRTNGCTDPFDPLPQGQQQITIKVWCHHNKRASNQQCKLARVTLTTNKGECADCLTELLLDAHMGRCVYLYIDVLNADVGIMERRIAHLQITQIAVGNDITAANK